MKIPSLVFSRLQFAMEVKGPAQQGWQVGGEGTPQGTIIGAGSEHANATSQPVDPKSHEPRDPYANEPKVQRGGDVIDLSSRRRDK
jgi:hypothetical protein